jgi:queuine/archaeosine tRNA-ribosyltransferase
LDLLSASRRLRSAYQEHSWADRFALPDAPITSLDSRGAIKQKLASTRRQYRIFPAGLSGALRPKLLPVVHGTTPEEVCWSALAARSVGSKSLGFGGFATSGPNSGVNSFTPGSLQLLIQFAVRCAEWKLDNHVFGIGGPAAIVVLHYAGVTTFDSAGWIRTAAYGNVYLPFLGAVNITGGAVSRRCVTRREFSKLCKTSGHACVFCADVSMLMRSWPHRALHNYCTIAHTTRELDGMPPELAIEKLRAFNPRFAGYLELVLAERARLLRTRASRGSAAALRKPAAERESRPRPR